MSARPWYKRYGADFVHGTLGLTLEQKGAYSLCLDLIYDRGGPIPDDARWLAGVCGVSLRKWTALRGALITAGKLAAVDGSLTNHRAEVEIESAAKTARILAENGAKGGSKRAENSAARHNINDLEKATLKHRARDQKPEPDSTDPGGSVPRERWPADAFEQFWARYPAKVGKAAASTAFAKVRKSNLVAFAALMAGLDAYVRHKPPDRDWCHPTTWLNQGRWDDEWTDGQPQQARNGTGAGGGRKPTAHENLLAGFAAVAARHDRGGDVVPEARSPPGPDGPHNGPTLDLEARRGVDPRDDAPWPDAGDYGGRGAPPHRFPGH